VSDLSCEIQFARCFTFTRTGANVFKTPFGNDAGVEAQNIRIKNLQVSSLIEGFLLSRCATMSSIMLLRLVYKRDNIK